MSGELFTWKWNDYVLRVDERQGGVQWATLSIRGQPTLERQVVIGPEQVNVHVVADVITTLIEGQTEYMPDLVAMLDDVQHKADLLDWYECANCGRLTVTYDDEARVCMWCGHEQVE